MSCTVRTITCYITTLLVADAVADMSLPTDVPNANVAFKQIQGATCGVGDPAYYGYIAGEKTDTFFLEIMGGAVCFNASSCQDDWLGVWLNITRFLNEKLKLPMTMIDLLKSGTPFGLAALNQAAKPGYFPVFAGDTENPFYNSPGIFLPTCTSDVMMGQHTLNYDGMEVNHHGGINTDILFRAIKKAHPDLKKFFILGGSGGGVATSLWMNRVVEEWPGAEVFAFVDSGFHMFPGSEFYKFYYEHVPWSNGPGGDNDGKVQNVKLPKVHWLEKDAIVHDLKDAKGKLRIAYVACDNDYIVAGDRTKMSAYSTFDGNSIKQGDEMWGFLTNLHKCAPEGTAFSYIGSCDAHHLTQGGISSSADFGSTTLKQFITAFLKGTVVEASDRGALWDQKHDIDSKGGVCRDSREPEEQNVNDAGRWGPMWQVLAIGFIASASSWH